MSIQTIVILCIIRQTVFFAGDWVLVSYDNKLYPGEVIEILADSFYTVNVMHPSETREGRYKWPKPKKDEHIYHISDVERKIGPPEPCDNRSSVFMFSSSF